MKVTNIHKRIINQPKQEVGKLFETLATENDKVWPTENWHPMKFKDGFKVGSTGGHGPIGYSINNIYKNEFIEFKFVKPKGYKGIHKFELIKLTDNSTEIKHTIEVDLNGFDFLGWAIIVKYLHDALLEDCFDKVENQFGGNKKKPGVLGQKY